MRSSRIITRLVEWVEARLFRLVRTESVLLIPSDPWTLAGSIGDAAMITAVVDEIRAGPEELGISVLTDSAIADVAASRLGIRPLRIEWGNEKRFWSLLNRIIHPKKVRAVVIVGADVLDGGYGPWIAKRLLAVADLAASRKIPTAILGFSFKREPAVELREIWTTLNPAVAVNVRDPRSLARFRAFSGREATLVADCAFMLKEKAGPTSGMVESWTGAKRKLGRRILGINFHPQLFGAEDGGFPRLTRAFERALTELANQDDMSFVILPHDNRPNSDRAALEAFSTSLAEPLRNEVLFVGEEVGPAEIKAIAATLDGVITGRMHLAIASLGVGTPVVALTYQDKFEGLFDHFELPSWLLSTPEAASEPDNLIALIRLFGESLQPLKSQIENRLPDVRLAARHNIATLGLSRKA
jgi:polysaccharide pyruvyl transferase WcaK-like protein